MHCSFYFLCTFVDVLGSVSSLFSLQISLRPLTKSLLHALIVPALLCEFAGV